MNDENSEVKHLTSEAKASLQSNEPEIKRLSQSGPVGEKTGDRFGDNQLTMAEETQAAFRPEMVLQYDPEVATEQELERVKMSAVDHYRLDMALHKTKAKRDKLRG